MAAAVKKKVNFKKKPSQQFSSPPISKPKKFRSKSSFKGTVLVFLIFLLSLSYYVLYGKKQANTTTTPKPSFDLLTFTTEDVTSVEINNAGSKLLFDTKDSKWYLTSDSNKLADTEKITALLSDLKNLQGYQKIEKDNLVMREYGLDPVSKTITITTGTQTYRLTVGNKTPTNNQYYVSLDNQTIVFTADAMIQTILEKKAKDLEWVPPTLTPQPTHTPEAIEVTSIPSE